MVDQSGNRRGNEPENTQKNAPYTMEEGGDTILTIALPTGRVMRNAIDFCEEMGLPVAKLRETGRQLVVQEGDFRYILSKPSDVPLYVSHGVADIALAGSDVLRECTVDYVELADTGRGQCRIVIAGPQKLRVLFSGHPSELMWLKVATKYPHIADSYFSEMGVQVEIIHLHGSIELAPTLGMSDCILDIVQTGDTLKANKLIVLKEIAPVSLRLIASRQSVSLKWQQTMALLKTITTPKGETSYEH